MEYSFNRVVQALQHDPSLVLAQLDFQNAFNLVCRDNIFKQVKEICPEIGQSVSACYGGVGYLFVGEHLITASKGVHHGDPLGPLLFALAILQGWYLDDSNLIRDTYVIRRVIHAVVEEGPSWGIFHNLRKTVLWWPTFEIRRDSGHSTEQGIGGAAIRGTSVGFGRVYI
jgi:hypothetical protein